MVFCAYDPLHYQYMTLIMVYELATYEEFFYYLFVFSKLLSKYILLSTFYYRIWL